MTNHADISAREVVRDRWGHWTHPFYYSPSDNREYAPPGEGWFTGSIHDTEDGPVCVWLRPLTAKADE